MFAYCFNNPVNHSDSSGNWPKWLKTVGNAIVSAGKSIGTVLVLGGAVLFFGVPNSTLPALKNGKEAHYNRNDNNTAKIETIDQVPSDWTTSNTVKYPERKKGAAANAHQNTAPSKDKPNTKFSSPDKHEEVIFSYDEVLIVNPVDVGTYNYGTNIFTHWELDVVPWLWWGNSEDDPTTFWDRANIFVWGAAG